MTLVTSKPSIIIKPYGNESSAETFTILETSQVVEDEMGETYPATEKSFFVKDGKLMVCEYEVTKSPVTGNNIFFKKPNSEREATDEERGAIR